MVAGSMGSISLPTKVRVRRPKPFSPMICSTLPTLDRLPLSEAKSSTLVPDRRAGRVALPDPIVRIVSQPVSAMNALACSP